VASTSSSTTTTTTGPTTTAAAKPTPCLLDEIGSSLTCASVVRMVAFLWTLPASLVLVAGVRIIFDRPPSPVATAYVDISRAAAVLLAAFTLLIGGIWLVRSDRVLPSLGDLNGTWMNVAGHLRFGLLSAVGLVGALATEPGDASLILASVAALAGFVAGLVLPRWIIRIAVADNPAAVRVGWERDRAVVCAAVLATLIVFEVTVGWWHSMLLADGASVLSGVVAIIRGVALTAAVAAMIIGSRR